VSEPGEHRVTKPEALLELHGLTAGLPPGTVEERTAKAAERLASHEESDLLRGLLVELALQHLVAAAGGGR
jgi:hypothetical protein